MSVVVEKPYRFVPPHRGNLWPSFIQQFRLVDYYLRKKDGVVSYECRHADRLAASVEANHGILLAPNHCRYADPLVLGWLARRIGRHLYAMASWHLFNKSRLERFAIPKMGAFSIWREGVDRPSIETAIQILADAERPLLIFPEGTTNRTNDYIRPLLDGPAFIARAAARRRAKAGAGAVVIHPVAIKYVFRGDIHSWADDALGKLESRLSWYPRPEMPLLKRVWRVAEGLLSLKEIQYYGHSQSGPLEDRRDALVDFLLRRTEQRYGGEVLDDSPAARVRALRSKIVPILLDPAISAEERQAVRRAVADVDVVYQLISYPSTYLDPDEVTDSRVLETVERMQEDFFGRAQWPGPLHAIIEVGEAIAVPTDRAPRRQTDPLLEQTHQQLSEMMARLSTEANRLPAADTAAADGPPGPVAKPADPPAPLPERASR